MGKHYDYSYVLPSVGQQPTEFWAWAWGALENWTSERVQDADSTTLHARVAFKKLGNKLILALPPAFGGKLKKKQTIDILSIQTYRKGSRAMPERTTTYYDVLIDDKVEHDFSNVPRVGIRANYTEVHCTARGGLTVAS